MALIARREVFSRLDTLPDGDYDFEILDAAMDRSFRDQALMLRVLLKVLNGPCQDLEVEHVYWFKSKRNVEFLGGALCTLGFDADRWTAVHRRKFSAELPRAVEKLPGIRFRGTKKTNKDNGTSFHNLYINARLGNTAMPEPGPISGDIEQDGF